MFTELLLQVMTMQQTAEVMVHSYPKMPVLEDMFNSFAAAKGFPSAESLIAKTDSSLLEAEWAAFWEYTRVVDPDHTRRIEHVSLHGMLQTACSHLQGRMVHIGQHQSPLLQQSKCPGKGTSNLY